MFLSSRDLSTLIPKTIKGVDLNPSWLDLYRSRKMGFMYYALMDLQENAAIMEYSIDKNILFIEPPYPLFGAKASYKGSLYDKLIKKEFRKEVQNQIKIHLRIELMNLVSLLEIRLVMHLNTLKL